MKILLIDDHALFSAGVAQMLGPLSLDVQTVAAESFEEALELLNRDPSIGFILIDLQLPGMSGMEGISVLRERFPNIPVVVMSCQDDQETVLQAIERGAMGFIPKTTKPALLVPALQIILKGGIYLPPCAFLVQMHPSPPSTAPAANEKKESKPPPADLGLPPQATAVLHRILQGKSTKDICREMGLAPSTVKVHTTAVLRALNVTSRTQAVVAAYRLGLRFE